MALAATVFLSEDDFAARPTLRGLPESERAAEADEESGASSSRKRTVLVTDDDDGVRETLVAILEMAGYDVLEAADGEQALHALHAQHIDVLLLDLAMPRLDGLSVLREMGPPPPRVVVHSAFAYYDPDEIDRLGLSDNVTKALQKPCPPTELLAAIDDAMDVTES